MGRVINIVDHDHFADYAEPANVVPVIPPQGAPYERYDRNVRVGLTILGLCVVVAVVFVKCTWN